MSEMGVNAQVLPSGEIYPSLERGAIDAAEWVGPYDDEKLGFHRIVRNYHYPGWWEPGPALSFYVNRRAQAVRETVLEERRQEIRELQQRMTTNGARSSTELRDVELQLQIQTLRDDFADFKSVNLYPLSVSILSRLASSLLLPLGFMLLETYVLTG